MTLALRALAAVARRGRAALIVGLAIGAAAPGLAEAMKPALPALPAVLLTLAALRMGAPREALEPRAMLGAGAVVLALQLALPCALAVAASAAGLSGPLVAGVLLMSAAPSIAGGPSIALLAGGDAASAMRLLFLGTAALPATAAAVFWLAPGFGGAEAVGAAALRLLAVILGAGALAALLRRSLPALARPPAQEAIEGLSVIALVAMVVALMSAVGPALRDPDAEGAAALATAFAANFGLQIVALAAADALGLGREKVSLSIVAGNRNVALFLVALPPETTDPLLTFIGFYQIPMFLTPILQGALARRRARA